MPVDDSRTVLLVPPPRRAVVPGVLVLRGGIDPGDIGEIRGVPSTWRERTIFDCLRLLPERAGLALLDQALVERWASVERLTELAHQHVGHHGVGRVREALRVVRGGERSEAERVLTRLLTEARITGWRTNAPIADGRGLIGVGDVVFARRKLVLEVDGWAYHSAEERFQRDRTRQNRLVAAGWTVLRFTWRELTHHPDRVISTLREVLGQVRVA
jgi:very-short-patch-repair endonuclease